MIRVVRLCLGFILLTFSLFAEDQAKDAGTIYLEGRKLAFGERCQIDMIRARELYRKAADLGDPRALAWKARSIYRGTRGFSKDETEARRILQEIEPQLRKMGLNKQPDALGSLCRTLSTIEPKTRGQEAFELAKKNTIDGKPSDWATMGRLFQDGIGVLKDEKEAVKWYTKSAEQGDAYGQSNLGACYFNGTGVAKDEKEAVKWYGKAADKGDGWSQNELGRCYANGIGVEKDFKKALEWYRKGAEQGDGSATGSVGWCYETGKGVAKDEKQALGWYLKAAEAKQAWSMGQLARMYEEGRGTDKNPTEAFRWWNQQAEAGDFWAPENVARCYANGIGTQKNPEEATKWYGKVRAKLEEETKKNEAWPWDNLGRFYFNGLGAQKDYAKALECYHKAADLKSGWSMEQIGWCYENGKGVAKDDKEALRWYLKAAEAGQTWSMGQCALFYENGQGTEKNPAKAFEFYSKAAEANYTWAQNALGNCYFNAHGVERDPAKAFSWYTKAAEQGSRNALENLGRCYAQGAGVEKNERVALEKNMQAAGKGSAWAQAETGRYFIEGIGTKKDKKIALQWFRKSAAQGNAYAQSWVGKAINEGWGQKADPEEAARWYRKSAEGGHAWSWAALGQHYKSTGKSTDIQEALRCFEKANWAGNSWGTRLLAECYAEGAGVRRDPDLAASLFERVIGTSEENSARWSLVDLHWGGVDRWAGGNLQRGLDHWLALHPNPTQRGAAIYQTAVRFIDRGRPNSVGAFMDLLETQQKADNQFFPPDQKVFRGVCRLMADRHVPQAWEKGIPSFLETYSDWMNTWVREPDGGKLDLNCGHLETKEKMPLNPGGSYAKWAGELWISHVQWLVRLLAEEESGWYNSFVRSLKADDRSVNLRWLEGGVTRQAESWKDVENLQAEKLSLRGVAGALLIARLNENSAPAESLIKRLNKIEAQKIEKKKGEIADKLGKKEKKGKSKINETDLHLIQQIRDLAEPGPMAAKWWREKGAVSFGFGMSSQALGGRSGISLVTMPQFSSLISPIHHGLFTLILRSRPDLVLSIGADCEPILVKPEYSQLGGGPALEFVYETLASQVPSSRKEALQALARWSRLQGNEVTAEQWEEAWILETRPRDGNEESSKKPLSPESFPEKPRIPEEFKETADKATALYNEKKFDESAAAYEQILVKYPQSIYALSNLGVVRFQQQKYPEAEKALREAIRVAPNDAFSHSVLGIAFYQQGNYDDAIKVLSRAVALDPNDAKTRNYLGISSSHKGLQEAAEQECTKAIELDEGYGDAHFNLAVIYATKTPPTKELAKRHYNRALKLGLPKDAELEKLLK